MSAAPLFLAFIAGIHVKQLNNEQAQTTVRYKWLTQNPFRSMYFACLAMAAEMSTGLLVMNLFADLKPPVSMLITQSNSVYLKKAVGKITFTCNDGNRIAEALRKLQTQENGVTIELKSTGINSDNEIVAEYTFTWSLKAKAK